jgi:hypothetical protein
MMLLVGYHSTCAYKLYCPKTNRIEFSRDVTLKEIQTLKETQTLKEIQTLKVVLKQTLKVVLKETLKVVLKVVLKESLKVKALTMKLLKEILWNKIRDHRESEASQEDLQSLICCKTLK